MCIPDDELLFRFVDPRRDYVWSEDRLSSEMYRDSELSLNRGSIWSSTSTSPWHPTDGGCARSPGASFAASTLNPQPSTTQAAAVTSPPYAGNYPNGNLPTEHRLKYSAEYHARKGLPPRGDYGHSPAQIGNLRDGVAKPAALNGNAR